MRWWILSLLFLGTTVNYLDRIILGILLPEIRKDIPMTDQVYGYVTGAFQVAYTAGFLIAGKTIDKIGTRLGYSLAILWWSVAAALHSLASSAATLGMFRAILGIGEAGNFPAAIKGVSEWFAKKDQALATGIFNAGASIATMIGPGIFLFLTSRFGWRACFLLTASSGLIVLLLWFFTKAEPPEESGTVQEPKLGWIEVLGHKETWGYAAAKFFSDPVWWFYLNWLPPYFYDVRSFKLSDIAWAFPFIYLMADFGSVGGGWLAGFLIRRGWDPGKARLFSMGVCAACMPVAATSVLFENPFVAIALISVATAAHQGWSANLYITVPDVFPKNAVASATGIGACLGGFGGVIFSSLLPAYIVTNFGYTPIFFLLGGFHLTGFVILRYLMGDLKPVTIKPKAL